MPDPEIRETIVTPDAGGSVVQLQISDGPLQVGPSEILIHVSAKLPAYKAPLFAQLQREAMRRAQDALSMLLQKLASEITAAGHALNP